MPVAGGGGSGSDPLPAALAPGERTRLWAPALCGDSALIPRGAEAVLALPVAMAAALVRAIGELAEFVLQVRDALLLCLDCLLQGTDLLQHLFQGWPLRGGDTWGHRGAASGPSPTPGRGTAPPQHPHPQNTHGEVGVTGGVAAAGARGGLVVQDVLLDHLQLPVLDGDIAVPQRDEDGLRILPRQPLVCLQGRLEARRVRVQVVLEEV